MPKSRRLKAAPEKPVLVKTTILLPKTVRNRVAHALADLDPAVSLSSFIEAAILDALADDPQEVANRWGAVIRRDTRGD